MDQRANIFIFEDHMVTFSTHQYCLVLYSTIAAKGDDKYMKQHYLLRKKLRLKFDYKLIFMYCEIYLMLFLMI